MTDGSSLPQRLRPARFSATKFVAPPATAGFAPRPRLLDRLSQAEGVPVTLVVGAVGSGKTALVAEWCRAHEDTTAWISVDPADADPTRFCRALIAAVQRFDPTFGVEASDLITLDGHVTADAIESLMVDESLLGRRLCIVIDDAQLVSAGAMEQLGLFILRRPVNLRFVLISRTDPAIGLPRLRLQGLVAEIRDHDLRLEVDEVRQMLTRMGLDVNAIDVDDLCRRTEGWAAGLQLAALFVLGVPDAESRLRLVNGTHSAIASYLIEEVLTNQPAPIHRFLEDTCVVDELDIAMCEALIADDDLGKAPGLLLREVEEANLFLTRVDPAGTIYRYHQLFVDLLRDQLRTRDPDRYRRQHRRAAEAHLALGSVIKAVNHFWKAGERELAAQLISQAPVSAYLTIGESRPVDIHGQFAEYELLEDPSLVGGYALALSMNGRGREVRNLIARVDEVVGLSKIPPAERVNLMILDIGAQMMLGNSAAAVRDLRKIDEEIATGAGAADDWMSVGVALGARAAAWEGDFELAERMVSLFPANGDPHLEQVDLAAARATIEFVRGDANRAIELATGASKAALTLGVQGAGSDLSAKAVLGAALVDRGELEAAEPFVSAVLDASVIERVPSLVLATLARARILRARNDYDGALGAIAVARSRFGSAPNTLSNYLDLAEFMVAGALRDTERAEELSTRIIDPLLAGRMTAWLQLMSGRLAVASATADSLVELATTPRERFELGVLLARIAFERQSPDIDRLAGDVLSLADQTGLLFHIAEGGTGVLQEVRRVARGRARSDAIDRIGRVQPLLRAAHRLEPHHPHDELSAREQIVLRYMATSMNNQEIAAALYLSVNTVKTHVKNVLRKMRATSRAQAVERARELNYL